MLLTPRLAGWRNGVCRSGDGPGVWLAAHGGSYLAIAFPVVGDGCCGAWYPAGYHCANHCQYSRWRWEKDRCCPYGTDRSGDNRIQPEHLLGCSPGARGIQAVGRLGGLAFSKVRGCLRTALLDRPRLSSSQLTEAGNSEGVNERQ